LKNIILFILFISFIPMSVIAQKSFDLTGRVSLQVKQIEYDENSKILPDSISDEQYGKTSLIPGLQQSLNLSLFGRTQDLDMTLLADLTNNDWNKLDVNDYNSISRLSLDLRFYNNEFVIGDFFETGSEVFVQSREIRGLKYSTKIDELFGQYTYLSFNGFGGITQKAIKVGERLTGIYKQFETSGQFRRLLAAGDIKMGKTALFNLSFRYLQGKDDEGSIGESINRPLENMLLGSEANLFLWEQRIRLFGNFYQSRKDTLDAGSVDDNLYSGGFDFRYNNLKLILLYQRIGYNYYSMGYPFLENDKNGFKGNAVYYFPNIISLTTEMETYKNNLDDRNYIPTVSTNRFDGGFSTLFPKYPEFTFNFGLRTDLSDMILDRDSLQVKTDKLTQKYEIKLGYQFGRTRLSLSATKLKLDDKSIIGSGSTVDSTQITPLGTDQFITTFNFYSQLTKFLFFSGGVVYSTLTLTNDQKNDNFYFYESNRWDIVPRKLKLETTMTAILNDAKNGGVSDYLSDYLQVNAQISLEYFFTDFISFKILGGTDSRTYKYTTPQATDVISNKDYGLTYFNANEEYSGLIFGGELNWNF